jgi:hypothetical protein
MSLKAFWNWLWGVKTTDDQITEKKAKLESARKAVETGASLCREYERNVRIHSENRNVLRARVDKALKDGRDDEAMQLQEKLDAQEDAVTDYTSKFEAAKKDQELAIRIVEQFQQNLHGNVNDLQEYKRQLEIAEAKKETAKLAADLSTESNDLASTKADLKRKIDAANFEAETVASAFKPQEDKFSDMAKKEEMRRKLQQRKEELKV